MNEILLIAGMAFVTYGIRVVLLPAANRMEFPPLLKRALHYVPAAVLTAIIVPAVLMPGGSIQISLNNAHLMGGLAAVLAGWLTKNLLATIVAGMALFWIWPFIMALI